MEFKRCFACMEEMDTPGGRCPHCGYDNTEGPKAQPGHVLSCGAVLEGRYVVGRSLGQGGFGITYIGYDLKLNLIVCIKEYYPEGAAMRSATQSNMVYWGSSENAANLRQGRESFVREAQKAVKLRDLRCVVKVWDVFFENETAYIVMDYVRGETLKARLYKTQRRLGEAECVRLLQPVMEDLEQAHGRGIIHRDIKPDNLMLTPDGRPVLLDMGAAKDLSRGSGQSSFMVASQGFSPVEQYRRSGSIGPWTDVYAMCSTMYWCIGGKVLAPPLDRMSGETVDWSAFSPAMAAVLQKGLALRPEDRIQSMGELMRALKALSAPEKAADKQPEAPAPAPVAPPEEAPLPESMPATAPSPIMERAAAPSPEKKPVAAPEPTDRPTKKKKPVLPMAAAAVALAGAVLFAVSRGGKTPEVTAAATPSGEAETVETAAAELTEEDGFRLLEIGYQYLDGDGVPQSDETAAQYFLQAAAAGNAAAMNNLGWMYEFGTGLPQDNEKAFYWLQKAADAGDQSAVCNLAWMYLQAEGMEPDGDKAKQLFLQAAEAGVVGALSDIGMMYAFGIGVEQDYAAAMEWYQKAAERGDGDAMFNIGMMYEFGDGVEQDWNEAMAWYVKSADAGYSEAMHYIGELYEEGRGVPADRSKAEEWYQKARDAGYKEYS